MIIGDEKYMRGFESAVDSGLLGFMLDIETGVIYVNTEFLGPATMLMADKEKLLTHSGQLFLPTEHVAEIIPDTDLSENLRGKAERLIAQYEQD